MYLHVNVNDDDNVSLVTYRDVSSCERVNSVFLALELSFMFIFHIYIVYFRLLRMLKD